MKIFFHEYARGARTYKSVVFDTYFHSFSINLIIIISHSFPIYSHNDLKTMTKNNLIRKIM